MYSYMIMTTSLGGVMESIHDPMPVILEQDDCRSWLEDRWMTLKFYLNALKVTSRPMESNSESVNLVNMFGEYSSIY
jgi:putative SOS response-associated peptidase YedK